MFSRNNGTQRTQIEALEMAVNAQLSVESITYPTATPPTQAMLEVYANIGAKIYWWDGTKIRGIYGAIYDYFLPLFSSAGNTIGDGSTLTLQTPKRILWRSDKTYYVHGTWYSTTTGAFTTHTRRVDLGDNATLEYLGGTSGEMIDYNIVGDYVLYISGTSLIRNGTGGSTTIATVGAPSPQVAVVADDGRVFFRNAANPNNVQRYQSGVVTTIVTGFTDLYHMKWDETNQKLLLFSASPPSTTTACSKVNPDGTGLTSLVPSGAYAAGKAVGYFGAGTYDYTGVEVIGGYLHTHVPGNPYINNYRRYNIATGTYVDTTFDFGLAKPIIEPAVIEARKIATASAGYLGSKPAQFYGTQFYAYLFDRLIDAQYNSRTAKWLLTYETGALSPAPGAQSGLAYAILPEFGSTGKIYPLAEATDSNTDVIIVAERTYDTAVKEMTLEFDLTAIKNDYTTYVLEFDNGLISATENIRVQFGGDTGANYDYSFYRNVVSTISNTTAAAAAYIELYGVNTTTVLGGRYELTTTGYLDTTAATTLGWQIEGFTATGVATNNVNSILGVAKWAKPLNTIFNSVRVSLSASTASFPTGAVIRLSAYKTRFPAITGGNAL